jgi:hypothetical protein
MWLGKLLLIFGLVVAAFACSQPQIIKRQSNPIEIPASANAQRVNGTQSDWTYGSDSAGAIIEIEGISGPLSPEISLVVIWPRSADTAALEGQYITYRLGFPPDAVAPFSKEILLQSCEEYRYYSPSSHFAVGSADCMSRWLGNKTLRWLIPLVPRPRYAVTVGEGRCRTLSEHAYAGGVRHARLSSLHLGLSASVFG